MISILIPVYNGIEYLPESLASVIAQTYENWEVIIGVNGYPEGSNVWQAASKYSSGKVKVFDLYWCHSKPQALNAMVPFTSYSYLCLLDVDDIWGPTKLQKQIGYMGKYHVVGTDAQYFGERCDHPNVPLNEIAKSCFRNLNPIVNSSSMFLKEDAHWEEIEVEDYEMWCRLAASDRKFFNVPEILVKHRIHKNSAFNTRNLEDLVIQVRKTHGFL